MRSLVKSIAIVATFSLAWAAAGAEPAKEAGASAAASVFADSFGLNAAERNPQAKQAGSPLPMEPRQQPVSDSFGLNNATYPAIADCPAAKAESKSVPSHRRCIEI